MPKVDRGEVTPAKDQVPGPIDEQQGDQNDRCEPFGTASAKKSEADSSEERQKLENLKERHSFRFTRPSICVKPLGAPDPLLR